MYINVHIILYVCINVSNILIYKLDIRWYKFVNKWIRYIIITYNLLIICFSKKKKKLIDNLNSSYHDKIIYNF